MTRLFIVFQAHKVDGASRALTYFRHLALVLGAQLGEYRRAVLSQWKNELWHWRPECPSFPTRSFIISAEKPLDVSLCSTCARLLSDLGST